MKTLWITFFIACALCIASCTPPVEPIPAPATPKPVPTPHPAKGATEAAIRLYPDLAQKDSTFNRAFLELYEQQKKTNPDSLTTVDWPLDLARRTAAMLKVSPYTPPPPYHPPIVVATPAPNRTPNALDRGAYGEKRGVAKPPIFVDKDGYRIR